jgi:molybdate-binding protein/transcriptional regulator with XRE-family HTH domain
MDKSSSPSNRVRQYRTSRGWSQADLARRAGISRAAVSAVEIDRLVPSVAAGLALAAALGCTVEALFGPADTPSGPEWAWPPAQTPCRYWQARVGGRVVRYPAEATPTPGIAHDGLYRDGAFHPRTGDNPDATLVVASCDPAAGLLAAEYARATGFRLLVLPRSSRAALTLLGRGLVHAAGVHFATPSAPDGNDRAVADLGGADHRLLRVADWQEGLAVARGTGVTSVGRAVRSSALRWVGREHGSAARQCLDDLRPDRPAPRRVAHDHRGVAEAVRSGWADVGVCHRLVAEEAGLGFLPVRQEGFDLCFPAGAEGDPRLAALVRLVRSADCRRLLGDLPGIDTRRAGEVRAAGVAPTRVTAP